MEPPKRPVGPAGSPAVLDWQPLEVRRAVLATVRRDGSPRVLPICFAAAVAPAPEALPRVPPPLVLYSPIDEKPKRAGPSSLGRIRDIAATPAVTVLIDRWDEDWSKLRWLAVRGRATILEPGSDEHRTAVALLRAKYAQYAGHALDRRPIVRIEAELWTAWSAAE